MTNDTFTWSQDPAGNAYIGSKTSVTDPGTSNAQSALTTRTEDQYGNVLTSVLYAYNNTSSPLRTYTNTYLGGSGYISSYILNRLSTSSLNLGGGVTKTLATNYV
jgi:hypothetical protein